MPSAARADSRAQKYYYEDIAQPFFAPDPAHPGMMHNVRPGSKSSLFAAVKPKDGYRVFVIGGSIAGLLQYTGEKGELAQALAAALPTKKVDVINCGMAGYESYREALVEQEILEYSPDLIVFLTGHNEGIASSPIPIWVMHTQERLSRFGAYRALVKKLHPDPLVDDVHTEARADARDATFARNLSENIRHARERGVAVAVVVPPRNYREPAETGRMQYDADFVPGWMRFLQGDYGAARKSWEESLARTGGRPVGADEKAFTWGFIGRSEEKLGRLAEARAAFEQAAQYDRAAICGALCQGIIRRVTAKEGGFLVEADKMFRGLAYPRMPGMETFNDRMHWKPRFNCLMATTIMEAARADASGAGLPWDAGKLKELEAGCEKPGGPSVEGDDLRILSYVVMGLSWPNLRLSPVSVFYLQAIRHDRPEWFSDVPKLIKRTTNPQTDVYGLVMADDSVLLPRFYWHIAEERLLEKEYGGAIKDYERALALDPSLSWARMGLGAALALSGDKKGALAQLKDAAARSARDPRGSEVLDAGVAVSKALDLGWTDENESADPKYWADKAEAALNAGRKAEGLAALEKARNLLAAPPAAHDPKFAPARRLVARMDRDSGDWSGAAALLEELVAESPRDAGLRIELAAAAAGAGDRARALKDLDEASGLEPDRDERHRMALLRQELKDYEGALALLRPLASEKADAAVLGDLGVCELLAGRPDAAIPALEAAIKLEPAALPPYFTLATIYADRKELDKELGVYDSVPPAGGDPELRALLAKYRREAADRARPKAKP